MQEPDVWLRVRDFPATGCASSVSWHVLYVRLVLPKKIQRISGCRHPFRYAFNGSVEILRGSWDGSKGSNQEMTLHLTSSPHVDTNAHRSANRNHPAKMLGIVVARATSNINQR